METEPTMTDPCHLVAVDGETVSVQGNVGEWTPEDHAAFAEIVRAAKAKYDAEHPTA
jgi:hypothetical protein